MSTARALPVAPAAPPFVQTRLSAMMFLQYAVWGIWLPILAKYLSSPTSVGGLGFSGGQVGWILGLAGSIGAIASPFIAGQLADRWMNAERALGLLLIFGGVVQAIMTWQTDYGAWLVLSIAYSVLYMPTLALTNSVAFANLPDREKQFPPVRTFGTIGWIVASVAFPLFAMVTNVGFTTSWPFLGGVDRPDAVGQMKYAMLASGIVSIGYGVYCLIALPATPPNPNSQRKLAFAAAFKLIMSRNVVALLVAALLISMIHQLYFIRTPSFLTDAVGLPSSAIGSTMAIGQISEIAFLAILGLFLKRVGYKTIIICGALSYAARYAIFGLYPTPTVVRAAMLLHGMNYGFFFAGAYLFIDRIAAADIRHSAQTAFGIVILGLGPVLAGFYNQGLDHSLTRTVITTTAAPVAPAPESASEPGALSEMGWSGTLLSGSMMTSFDYRIFWLTQAGLAALAAAVLLIAFPGRTDVTDEGRGFSVDTPEPL